MRKKKIINGVLYSVGAVIYNNKKEILMLKRKGKKWERGWEIVKGGVYFGETLKEAILRETSEEIGVKVKIVKVIPKIFWTERPWRKGKLKIKARVFICKYLSGRVKLGEPEHIGYKWMTINEAKKKIWLKDGEKIFDYLEKQNKNNMSKQKIILKGTPASPGQAKGKVKIILKPTQLFKMKEGNILVTQATNPLFTPAIIKASGIITDLGGVLSHSAVVAREMGIPAVVGTKEATKILKDNMIITLDGKKGIIYAKSK